MTATFPDIVPIIRSPIGFVAAEIISIGPADSIDPLSAHFLASCAPLRGTFYASDVPFEVSLPSLQNRNENSPPAHGAGGLLIVFV
jgi:hypothetical protein